MSKKKKENLIFFHFRKHNDRARHSQRKTSRKWPTMDDLKHIWFDAAKYMCIDQEN